jgi:hypothetical protein
LGYLHRCVFFLVVLEECVLDMHLMSAKDVQEIFTSCIPPFDSKGPITLECSSKVLMPMQALMSEPIITIVLELIEFSMELKELQNCSCIVSSQGKYVEMRAIARDLPLMHFLRLL